MKGVLIYCAHRVVYEIRAQKQRQQEDAGVMVLVLVEGTDALGVYDQDLVFGIGLLVFNFDWFVPNPEALQNTMS